MLLAGLRRDEAWGEVYHDLPPQLRAEQVGAFICFPSIMRTKASAL